MRRAALCAAWLCATTVLSWNRKQEEEQISHLPYTVPAPILTGIKGYSEFHEEGNYTVFVFKDSVPDAITYKGLPPTHLHILAVGGGGAGGDSSSPAASTTNASDKPLVEQGGGGGGGGGAGGVLEQMLTVAGMDVVSLVVGAGGKGAKRTNGADTLIQFQKATKYNLRAYGGGAGGLRGKGGAKGGSGGGHGSGCGPRKGAMAVNAGQGHPGGATQCRRGCGGSGGGGAGSPGGVGGNTLVSATDEGVEDAGPPPEEEVGDVSAGQFAGDGGEGRVSTLPGIYQLFQNSTYWGGGGGGAASNGAVAGSGGSIVALCSRV